MPIMLLFVLVGICRLAVFMLACVCSNWANKPSNSWCCIASWSSVGRFLPRQRQVHQDPLLYHRVPSLPKLLQNRHCILRRQCRVKSIDVIKSMFSSKLGHALAGPALLTEHGQLSFSVSNPSCISSRSSWCFSCIAFNSSSCFCKFNKAFLLDRPKISFSSLALFCSSLLHVMLS